MYEIEMIQFFKQKLIPFILFILSIYWVYLLISISKSANDSFIPVNSFITAVIL